MPRALSNPEFVQFYADNADLLATLMPEQSKVVSWNGMSVLAYIGPNTINVNDQIYPDVYLSDISDSTQLAQVTKVGYGTTIPQSMLDTLPQSVVDTLKEEAAAAGAMVDRLGKALAAAGQGAVDDILTPILIGAVILFGLLYLPKGR